MDDETRREVTTAVIKAFEVRDSQPSSPRFSKKFWATMVTLVGLMPTGLWAVFQYGVHEAGLGSVEATARANAEYIEAEQPKLEQMEADAAEAKESLEWLVCDRERRREELACEDNASCLATVKDCSPLAR
jgi:hypothetical protein